MAPARPKPRPRPAAERLFNPLRRKVLRKRISSGEAAFGALFLVLLGGAGLWVAAQRNHFDPAERDLSTEALARSSVEDTLYRVPLQRWRDPGAAAGPEAAAAVDLGIFPAGFLADGWSVDGRVETYDPNDVYEKIDGAAELYLRYGFQRLHYVTIAHDADLVTVELYDQGTATNALGVYSEQREPDRAVERDGQLELYRTPAGCIGRYDRYYFKIAGNSGGPAVLAKAAQLAALIGTLPVEAVAKPLPQRVLEQRLGFASDQLEYVKSDAFQFEFAADFWFARLPDAADARLFLHEDKDAAEAQALLRRIVQEQKNEYSVIEDSDRGALLQHEFLKTYFAIRLRGATVFGVEGAAGRPEAEAALSRLEEGLSLESKADPAP